MTDAVPLPPRSASFDVHRSWRAYLALCAERFGVAITRTPKEIWIDWEGFRLRVDEWAPEGTPHGVVILVHGGGGHGRILAPFANMIAGLGWRALAPDLPGYGLTQTPRGWRADYAVWPRCVAALTQAQNGPTVLFGASVGGMTALRAAQLAPQTAGVIVTTLLDLSDVDAFAAAARWPALGRIFVLVARHAPWLLDRLALPLAFACPMAAMSSDREMARYFALDPLLGGRWVSGRFFRTLHDASPPQPDLALGCPLLVLHPGADAWTPSALSRRTFDAVPGPKRFVDLPGGAHLPLEASAFRVLGAQTSAFLTATVRPPVAR